MKITTICFQKRRYIHDEFGWNFRLSNLQAVIGVALTGKGPFDAHEAMRQLRDVGVNCRAFFWPMHEWSVLRRMGLLAGARYPVAGRLGRRSLYLPSGLAVRHDLIDRAVDFCRSLFR